MRQKIKPLTTEYQDVYMRTIIDFTTFDKSFFKLTAEVRRLRTKTFLATYHIGLPSTIIALTIFISIQVLFFGFTARVKITGQNIFLKEIIKNSFKKKKIDTQNIWQELNSNKPNNHFFYLHLSNARVVPLSTSSDTAATISA